VRSPQAEHATTRKNIEDAERTGRPIEEVMAGKAWLREVGRLLRKKHLSTDRILEIMRLERAMAVASFESGGSPEHFVAFVYLRHLLGGR
jgi:hypothetical protein